MIMTFESPDLSCVIILPYNYILIIRATRNVPPLIIQNQYAYPIIMSSKSFLAVARGNLPYSNSFVSAGRNNIIPQICKLGIGDSMFVAMESFNASKSG
jgi:hypothetical protein